MRDVLDRLPPELRAELADEVAILEKLGPMLVDSLRLFKQLTTCACWAAENLVDDLSPEELDPLTDAEWEHLEAATGIGRGMELAALLGEALP
jgi:hypothetical protein